jgi:uncharacterized membrane protein YidH (DUF202 family)
VRGTSVDDRRDWQPTRVPRRGTDRALLALGALVVGSTIARFALSRDVLAPLIAPDEQLYGLLGRSLVSGEGLTVLGGPVPYYSILYPLLVGLPFVWADLEDGVRAVQLLQAFVMSLTAVPIYFWARPMAGRGWALVAASLTVLIPGLAYSGLLMSEALYYTVAVVAVWALAACLREPTAARQALFLLALGVALATRLQAVGFVAVLVVAVALLAAAERTTAPFRRMLPTFGVLGLFAVVWSGARILSGGVGELLGAYATLAEAEEYSVGDIGQSVAWQTGAVTLITVGVPLVALGILAWRAVSGAERDPRIRVLVAAALAYAVVTLVEVGVFASRFVEHVTERQLLSVAPPVFVAFAVWLRQGAPRPQPATSIVAFVVAASALLLPLDRVTTLAAYADAPSMIPLEQLTRQVGQTTFEVIYAGAVATVLLAAVLLPRRAVPVLPAVVALALAGATLVASIEIRQGSQTERERTFAGAPPDWIDVSGGDDVALLVTGQRLWPAAWETLFWNESITKVIRLQGVVSPGVVPQEVATVREDGRLLTPSGAEVTASDVAAPTGATIIGAEIAATPSSSEQSGMTLWRVDPPLRVSRRIAGVRPNGDLHGGEAALIRVYACGPGRLELTLLGKEGLPTRVLLDGRVLVEHAIAPEDVWRPSVPAPPSADGSGICRYRLETDGLIGSTRIEFVRTG